ncbi:MAG: ABC transporter ATP-binding protein [Actinobacteria bacterium]|nr:ABC transporter ATP-binding protein [Actinomycetota bacterium]
MDVLAETRQASRRFGAFTAVSSADMLVRRNEVVGLLGANGAGKTTLIRLLLGLLPPSSGAVCLFGSPPSRLARRRVGYVPQTLGLYAGLTVAENWAFTATAFGNASAPVPERIAAWEHELVSSLPLGTQRQVAFAVALSHEPELLVLDEPTSGVGPLGRARLWEEIRRAVDHGAGAFVTTHNMEEAEQCDRLVVMADGKVVGRGTAAKITHGIKVAEVRCKDWHRAFRLLDASGFSVQVHGQTIRVDASAARIGELLSREGIDATIDVVPANLEEAFVAMVSTPAPR